jgi:hypothetical protein
VQSSCGRRGRIAVAPMLTKEGLLKTKLKALRTGVWFSNLSRVERAIVNLTIKCVEEIHSDVLAKTISDIVGKILTSLPQNFVSEAQRVGREIAETLCTAGQKWHSSQATRWKCDIRFHRFLGVNKLNEAGWSN